MLRRHQVRVALLSFSTCFDSCRISAFRGKLSRGSGGAPLAVVAVCHSSSPSVALRVLRGFSENEGRFQPWHCRDEEGVCSDRCELAHATASSLNVL